EIGAELDGRNIFGAIRRARAVAEHEPRAGILQDEMDRRTRELEIDRDRDEAGAHDSVIGREIFGAIGGKDRDPLAPRETALGERAANAVRHGVDRGIAELARAALAAEIDDRGLGEV